MLFSVYTMTTTFKLMTTTHHLDSATPILCINV